MRKKYGEQDLKTMNKQAENLRRILVQKKISQIELCEKTGIARSAMSDYVNAKTMMSPGKIHIIANALGVRKSDIDPVDDGLKHDEGFVSLPVYGKVSCGEGISIVGDIESTEDTPTAWLNSHQHFYLIAYGDSMIDARIQEGDLLLIREQKTIENGEIAVVAIDNDAVLKRVYCKNNVLILQSENAKYEPIVLHDEEMSRAQILGKLIRIIIRL